MFSEEMSNHFIQDIMVNLNQWGEEGVYPIQNSDTTIQGFNINTKSLDQ